MSNKEEDKNLIYVYNKLLTLENEDWSVFDDLLCITSPLSDELLHYEAKTLYLQLVRKGPSFFIHEHSDGTKCFLENIAEATKYILELYNTTKMLEAGNRYILSCFLAICNESFLTV